VYGRTKATEGNMQEMIYVLHFDRKLAHAGHYVGSTKTLFKRLKRHAKDGGARILQACREQGIEWRLGGLMMVEESLFADSKETRVQKERRLKNQHNGKRFCQLCNETARKLTGTCPVDIGLLDMPTDSKTLRESKA
jgi:predicted GIY-YIG superfamily endonuclease